MKTSLLILIFISFYNTIWCIADMCKIANQPVFIVIALDGFRNSYFKHTPYLSTFRETGAHTKYLKIQNVSNALNSFQTVATGYWGDKHGVVGHQSFGKDWCRTTGETFQYDKNLYNFTRCPEKGPEIIPIWILNQQHHGVSACMMWPGSEFPYGEKQSWCAYIEKYDGNDDYEYDTLFDKVILWLKEKVAPPNLVMIYIKDPDKTAHKSGVPVDSNPNKQQVVNKLKKIDTAFEKFDGKLDTEANLKTRKNIIFLSDHGMVNVRYKNFIDKEKNASTKGCSQLYYFSTNKVQYVQVANEKKNTGCDPDVVFQTKYFYYTRYISVERAGSWVYVAPGKAIKQYFDAHNYFSANPTPEDEDVFGSHGYYRDKDSIFMAKGPAFNTGVFRPFFLEDFYSLLAKLLKIEGTFNHDGYFRNVKPLIKIRKPRDAVNWIYRFMIIFALAIIHCGSIYHYGNVREKQLEQLEQLERKARKKREKKKRQEKIHKTDSSLMAINSNT